MPKEGPARSSSSMTQHNETLKMAGKNWEREREIWMFPVHLSSHSCPQGAVISLMTPIKDIKIYSGWSWQITGYYGINRALINTYHCTMVQIWETQVEKYVLNYSHTKVTSHGNIHTKRRGYACACIRVCLAKPYTLHLLVSPFNSWKVLKYLSCCPFACTSNVGLY